MMFFFYFHDKMSSYIMICHELYPKIAILLYWYLSVHRLLFCSIESHSFGPRCSFMTEVAEHHKKPFSPNPDIFIPVMKSVFLRNQRHIFRKWPLPKCNVTVILVNQNTCLPVLLQQQKYFVRHHSSVYSLTGSSKDE